MGKAAVAAHTHTYNNNKNNNTKGSLETCSSHSALYIFHIVCTCLLRTDPHTQLYLYVPFYIILF